MPGAGPQAARSHLGARFPQGLDPRAARGPGHFLVSDSIQLTYASWDRIRQATKNNTRFTLWLQGTYNLPVFHRKVRESAGARLWEAASRDFSAKPACPPPLTRRLWFARWTGIRSMAMSLRPISSAKASWSC